MTRRRHQSPDWLKDRWADQKKATVTRIAGAIANLQKTGGKITYSSVRRSVEIALRCFDFRQYDQAQL